MWSREKYGCPSTFGQELRSKSLTNISRRQKIKAKLGKMDFLFITSRIWGRLFEGSASLIAHENVSIFQLPVVNWPSLHRLERHRQSLSEVGSSETADSSQRKSLTMPLSACFLPGFSSQAERKADNLHRHRLAHWLWRMAKYNPNPNMFGDTNASVFINSPPISSLTEIFIYLSN